MGLRILLLEDDSDLAEVERALFELDGHDVVWTASGIEALTKAARQPFDLALLDIEVEELSGLGVGRVLRDMGDVPVVVMSGLPNGWRREALKAGAFACVRKPADVDKLRELTHAVELTGRRGPPFAGDVCALAVQDLETIAKMPRAELDALPFGVMRLDGEGRIVSYNTFEARAAGRAQANVVGQYFKDVAPCVLVKEFVDDVERSRHAPVDDVLRFVFPHHGGDCLVSVRVYASDPDSGLFLFISKRVKSTAVPARPSELPPRCDGTGH